MNGGKAKLEMEVKILAKNAEQAQMRFKEYRQKLQEEESLYNKKASQYGQRWRTQPSAQLNRQYYNEIEGNCPAMQSSRRSTRWPIRSTRRSSRSTAAC
jgi:hypothetical protein